MADADAILERALAQLKSIHDSGDEGGAAVSRIRIICQLLAQGYDTESHEDGGADDERIASALAASGATELLVRLLDDPEEAEEAARALAVIALTPAGKRVVFDSGAPAGLLALLRQAGSGAQPAARAIGNLAVDNELVELAGAAAEPLVHLLSHGSGAVRRESAAALANLSVSQEGKQRVTEAGAVAALVELLGDGAPREEAARALANLAASDDAAVPASILASGGAPPLVAMLHSESAAEREEAAECLRCLASTPEGLAAITDAAAAADGEADAEDDDDDDDGGVGRRPTPSSISTGAAVGEVEPQWLMDAAAHLEETSPVKDEPAGGGLRPTSATSEQVLRARRKQAAAMFRMAEAAGEDVDEPPPPPPPVEDTKEVRRRQGPSCSFWSGLFAFSMVAAPAVAFLVLVWLGHGPHGDDLLANLRRVSPLT
jgi:hypothetical protein